MLLWASNTTPDVWGEKFGKKRLMSEMENAFKQEKQPTSKKENSKNRKELWQSRWSGPTDIDWRTYVRLQFFYPYIHTFCDVFTFFLWSADQETSHWQHNGYPSLDGFSAGVPSLAQTRLRFINTSLFFCLG